MLYELKEQGSQHDWSQGHSEGWVPATSKSYRLRNCAQLQMNAKASPIASVGCFCLCKMEPVQIWSSGLMCQVTGGPV